jgi:glycosyltransferase involved in cell wall biosynthesis
MTMSSIDHDDAPAVAAPPRVSVLVPTYNGVDLVGETLRSILDQGLPDIEVVVVDDGSTDGTPEKVLAIADGRIRLFRTPRNLGPPGARNFGFAHCRGRYIAPVDQDDILLPFRLARQVACLDVHEDTVLVATATQRLVGEERVTSPEPARTSPGFLRWALLVGNPLVWSSVLIRKSAVDALGVFNREDRPYAEDFDLYHRLTAIGSIARIDDVLTLYRRHEAGASHANNATMRASASRVLQDAYAPILRAGAARSAQVMTRHVSEGLPVPDIRTLRLIAAVVQAMTQYVKKNCGVDEVARGLIITERAALLQRLVRAAIRSGTISALVLHREGLLQLGGLESGAVLSNSMVGMVRRTQKRSKVDDLPLRAAPVER